jgi:hypothetical protein
MYLLGSNVATVTGDAFGNQIASVFLCLARCILIELYAELKKPYPKEVTL